MAFNFLTTTVRTEENRKPKVNEKSILFLLNDLFLDISLSISLYKEFGFTKISNRSIK